MATEANFSRNIDWPTAFRAVLTALGAFPLLGPVGTGGLILLTGCLGFLSVYLRGNREIRFPFDIVFSAALSIHGLILLGVGLRLVPFPAGYFDYLYMACGVLVIAGARGWPWLVAGICILLLGFSSLLNVFGFGMPLASQLGLAVATGFMVRRNSGGGARVPRPLLVPILWALAFCAAIAGFSWLVYFADHAEGLTKYILAFVIGVPLMIAARAFTGSGAETWVSGYVLGGYFVQTGSTHYEAEEGIGGFGGWILGIFLGTIGLVTVAMILF